jgi:hypothetical protein
MLPMLSWIKKRLMLFSLNISKLLLKIRKIYHPVAVRLIEDDFKKALFELEFLE